jgi:hypothetical protein
MRVCEQILHIKQAIYRFIAFIIDNQTNVIGIIGNLLILSGIFQK